MSLFSNIQDFSLRHGTEPRYWVAYSGGLDSHVLLHLMVRLRALLPIKLHAVHVNHNLSVNAAAWAKHAETVCRAFNVPLVQETIIAKATIGESPEEVAREKRYEVLSRLLVPNDLLLTAHHQDDQAETVLLQLMRGAGPKGLSAMPAIKTLGAGLQARPLLCFTREELRNYADEHQLQWIDDESNENSVFARNYMRQQIMPLLKNRWPSVTKTLARTAVHSAEAQLLLTELAQADLAKVTGTQPGTLSVSGLLTLSASRQRLVLRLWLEQKNYPLPDTVKLQQIQRDVLAAAQDKTPCLTWGGIELRRYQDALYVMPSAPVADSLREYVWDLPHPCVISGVGTLHAVATVGQGLRADLPVTVRFRQGGEVCRLPGRDFNHSLKKLLQAWRVPVWERDVLPLVYVGSTLVAVPGFFIAADFMAKNQELGYHLILDKNKATEVAL